MRVQLAQQAQDLLGQSDLVIITERVDDVALLLGQMVTMGFVEVLDRHLPRHWKQRGMSWGWTAVIWLAYILTEVDHRKVTVETYITGMHHTLSRLTAQVIEPLDFSDDRLSHLLHHLSKPKYWHQIERDLNARSIEVYALSQDVIRCDATTVSGDHEVTAGGLLQFGHSKDDPTRPQIKVMVGSLDPFGMPLATDVLSGERADDGLYIPVIDRIRRGLAHSEAGTLARIFRTNDRGHEVLAAEGYEVERSCGVPGGAAAWTERVLVLRSPMHAQQQAAGLETRLGHAEKKLAALTPPRGRGKRQITDETALAEAIDTVLQDHRVHGLLSVAWEKQIERKTQYVGRGRGAASRQQRVLETVRYHITRIARQGDTITALTQRFGWKAFVTNAVHTRLSLQEAVLCYRNEYRVERLFNRLKSRVHIAPLFVKRNEQIEGLTYLLTLGVRVLTVTEFVLRRSLEQAQASLPGLHPENKRKMADKPTAERILQAFRKNSLTIIKNGAGEEILRRLTPLSGVQEAILQRLGLGTNLYRQLEIQNIQK